MLIEKINEGMQELAQIHTAETLGDRSSYVGASDIGGCMRKATLSKLNDEVHSLSTLLNFKRGHMTEDIIAEALQQAGLRFKRQVEIEPDTDFPFKAHLDFVFESKDVLAVLEVKSVKTIPDAPYASWENQLYTQVGALAESTQKQVKGAILAVDLFEGEISLYNGYSPDRQIYEGMIEKGRKLWNVVTSQQPEQANTEVGPLCGYCCWIADCPAFDGETVDDPEFKAAVYELLELKDQYKALGKEIKTKSSPLLKIVKERGPVKVGDKLLRPKNRVVTYTDFNGLAKLLAEYGRDLSEFQESKPTNHWLDIV